MTRSYALRRAVCARLITLVLAAGASAAAPAGAQPPPKDGAQAEPALPPPPQALEPAAPAEQPPAQPTPSTTPAGTQPAAQPTPSPPSTSEQPVEPPANAPPQPATPAAAAPQLRFFGDDPHGAQPAAPRHRLYYGGELMIADAIAGVTAGVATLFGVACFVQTFEIWSDHKPDDHWTCSVALAGFALGAAVFVLAPPVVHLQHDRPGAAAASFAMRFAVPLMAILLIDAEVPAGGLLLIGGLLGSMLIDWYVLAYEDPEQDAGRPRSAFDLQPVLFVGEASIGAGVRGAL